MAGLNDHVVGDDQGAGLQADLDEVFDVDAGVGVRVGAKCVGVGAGLGAGVHRRDEDVGRIGEVDLGCLDHDRAVGGDRVLGAGVRAEVHEAGDEASGVAELDPHGGPVALGTDADALVRRVALAVVVVGVGVGAEPVGIGEAATGRGRCRCGLRRAVCVRRAARRRSSMTTSWSTCSRASTSPKLMPPIAVAGRLGVPELLARGEDRDVAGGLDHRAGGRRGAVRCRW